MKVVAQSRRYLGHPKPSLPILRRIHDAVLIPKITYGIGVIGKGFSEETFKQLTAVHRKLLITLSGGYKTTPYLSLCKILDIIPIRLQIEQQMYKWNYLYSSQTTDVLNLSIDRAVEEKFDKSFAPESEEVKKLARGKIKTQEELNAFLASNRYSYLCFTDGSKDETGCGYASIVYDSSLRKITERTEPLFKYASVFQCEALAIINALETLEKKIRFNSMSLVLTDSEIIYKALMRTTKQHLLIQCIREKLVRLQNENKTVHVVQVSSHSNVTGNEDVDQLAKRARRSKKKVKFDVIPRSHIKKQIEQHIACKAMKQFEQNKSRSLMINIPMGWNTSPYKCNISKELLWLLSGHGPFNQYLHRMRLKQSPTCPCGEGDMSNHHIVSTCSKSSQERDNLIVEATSQESELTNTVTRVLETTIASGTLASIELINHFAKEIIKLSSNLCNNIN
ncbi:uncharacterized protein LOC128387408 [Panonychus citri]|uniref:uncharacterized protein LOC128385938 n=1 Tax=Panonychus citri TaxID=50023 RepID=UPI0023073ECA|nr:uncharacterized protein LOC128385938 [Panonychus citri]XP_053202574.1 uncharacterized protein LOC128387408 [Panonychus citri]